MNERSVLLQGPDHPIFRGDDSLHRDVTNIASCHFRVLELPIWFGDEPPNG